MNETKSKWMKSLNSNWIFYLLILITLIGAVLRFYRLGYYGFWVDEIYTIYNVTHGFKSPVHPPLFFATVYPFIKILGISEFTARIPSALFGIATVPLVYLLGKEIFGRKEGLIASFIVSTSYWHIKLSQEARMYTELTFFVMLAFYFFILGIKKENLKYFAISTLFLLLAFYTQYVALITLPVMLLYLVFSRQLFLKEIFPKIIFCLSIFVILSFPLYNSILEGLEFKLIESRWGSPNAYSLLFSVFQLRLGISLSLFSIFGAFYVLYRRNVSGYLLILYAAIPLLVFSLLTPKGNIIPRYLLFTLPAYALLASYILMEIFRNLKTSKTLSLGFMVIILFSFQNVGWMYDHYYHSGYFQNVARPDWREAISYVEQNMDQGDLVASTAVSPKRYEYYPSPVEYYLKKPDIGLQESNDFYRVANSSERVWLLVDERNIKWIDPEHKFREWLEENCKRKTEIKQITVYLFDPSSVKS